jgi:hypothetical protein
LTCQSIEPSLSETVTGTRLVKDGPPLETEAVAIGKVSKTASRSERDRERRERWADELLVVVEIRSREPIPHIFGALARTSVKPSGNKAPTFGLNREEDSRLAMHDYNLRKEQREREKAEVLMRFRNFADQSTWKKARISRELGVSLSTLDRWLDGHFGGMHVGSNDIFRQTRFGACLPVSNETPHNQ